MTRGQPGLRSLAAVPWLPDTDRARIRALVAGGLSQAEVARRERLAESTVSRIVRGVDRRVLPEVLGRQVVEPVHRAGRTAPEIAVELGVDHELVRRSLRRHRLPLVSDGWLWERYIDGERTTTEMGEEAACHPTMIHRYLLRAGIPVRSRGRRRTNR